MSKGEGLRPVAEAIPLEHSIQSDGNEHVVYRVRGENEAAVDAARQALSDHFGVEPKEVSARNTRGSFFFSASNWNSSWEPEGPKQNWKTPPKDPSLN